MNAERLLAVAQNAGELASAQRLGHLLQQVGATALATVLATWIEEQRPRYVPLRADRSVDRAPRDARFRILVNETVEAEP